MDGFCSGAIVKKALLEKESVHTRNIIMYGYNYGDGTVLDKLPDYNPDIDYVYVVDLSLEDEEMDALFKNDPSRFLWIDHHKSAIEKSQAGGWHQAGGIRRIGDSASLLCWRTFFESSVPEVVYYVDRYDVFKNCDKPDWRTILCAQHGMRMRLHDPVDVMAYDEWSMLIDDYSMTHMIKMGATILEYLDHENERVARRAWPVQLGEHTIAMINYDRPDINISDHVSFQHDGMCFITEYPTKAIYSLRKKKEHKADILALAVSKGGGGHECACGFAIDVIQAFNYFEL